MPMLEGLASSLGTYLQGSLLLAFVASYIGGVLVSFTPCMYPLIPITVSYIGAQGKGTKTSGFVLSLLYVLGTSIAYTALGSIAGLSGTFFGAVQTSPWTNLVMANIFILMGLSMLDVFTIPLPQALSGQLFTPRRKGRFGAFLLGVASGLIMSPCSVPVLAVLLGYVATRQNTAVGMGLLFVFAFGMGTLLIVLGTFTSLLTSIPRSGPWLERIPRLFGFIFIAIGEYFLITAGKLFI